MRRMLDNQKWKKKSFELLFLSIFLCLHQICEQFLIILTAAELTGTPSSTAQPESSSSEDEELPQESQPLLTGRSVTLSSTPTVRIAPNEVEEIDDSRDVEAEGDDSSTSEKVQKSSDEESDEDVRKEKLK